MITKILYFRPDKRFVNDAELNEKYSFLIKDEFTTAENSITVPVYLTVFQHHIPKGKPKRNSKHSSSYQFLEKMCFYLVGSIQAPVLQEFSPNVQNIDRIEFKGHIGYEQPIFEIISQLPALRKVSFLINECKQKHFVADLTTKIEEDQIKSGSSPSNPLVTNVKISLENCTRKACCCKTDQSETKTDDIHQEDENTIKEEYTVTKQNPDCTENLALMIIRLLQRTVKQCPNIKHLCMDVPNYDGIKKAVHDSIEELSSLKPTKISCENGNVLVRKRTTDMVSSDNEDSTLNSGEVETIGTDTDSPVTFDKVVPEADIESSSKDDDEKHESKDQITADEPETTPCLFDMSKLLGSMLGIPTSSLPQPCSTSATTALQGSSTTDTDQQKVLQQTTADSQPLGNATTTITTVEETTTSQSSMNSTATNQWSTTASSSPTVEIITYAAAAASAAAANTTVTPASNNNHRHYHQHIRSNGNDNGGHHIRHHHHINEGSRRTFLRDGEGAAVDEEESSRFKGKILKKKPSVPHVADLGKPVFVSSSSCKSPHKRGI